MDKNIINDPAEENVDTLRKQLDEALQKIEDQKKQITRISSQIADQQKLFETVQHWNTTYSIIAQTLSSIYECVYYVDIDNDNYVEYSSSNTYRQLKISETGHYFFNDTQRNLLKVAHKDDRDMMCAAFDKDTLLDQLKTGRTFSIKYRLIIQGKVYNYHLRAVRTSGKDDHHIIVAVSNIDDEINREREYKKAIGNAIVMATVDDLTGTKNKNAYAQEENKIDNAIENGTNKPFSVVICDVNGLKAINDNLGHKAGDKLIKDAAEIICGIFSHSPVYRIGGDEFAVILSEEDYNKQHDLFSELRERVRQNAASGGVVIASGISEFDPSVDTCVASVFQRADDAMYENKKELKGGREEIR